MFELCLFQYRLLFCYYMDRYFGYSFTVDLTSLFLTKDLDSKFATGLCLYAFWFKQNRFEFLIMTVAKPLCFGVITGLGFFTSFYPMYCYSIVYMNN